MFAVLALSSQASAQSDDVDPEMRIQQLENQLRQLTGQNEELQYRNRQLEDRLRSLQGGAPGAPIGQAAVAQPNMAAAAPPFRRHRKAGAVAMPSTPIRIRMLRGRRGPWAVASFRFRPKRRSGLRAGAGRGSRSIWPTRHRAIRPAFCRHRRATPTRPER